jgi:hypothetical protein
VRKRPEPKTGGSPSNAIRLAAKPTDRPRLIAQMAVTPSLQAASTIKKWSHAVSDELDITGLIDELRQQAETASGGDLIRQEAMLAIQAHTLDTIFNELARRAQANMGQGQYLDAADRYMRLALKAQSQCRATIEALAEMKHPKPVAFVQQANIAHGPQQVNNASAAPESARARKSENMPNKLLEQKYEQWVDSGAMQAAGGGDSPLETLGPVHRATDEGR